MNALNSTFAQFIKPNNNALFGTSLSENVDNNNNQPPITKPSKFERQPENKDTIEVSSAASAKNEDNDNKNSNPITNTQKKSNKLGIITLGGAASCIPLLKRVQTIIECILNGEYIKGIGKGLVAGLNYLDDSSDSKKLKNEIENFF